MFTWKLCVFPCWYKSCNVSKAKITTTTTTILRKQKQPEIFKLGCYVDNARMLVMNLQRPRLTEPQKTTQLATNSHHTLLKIREEIETNYQHIHPKKKRRDISTYNYNIHNLRCIDSREKKETHNQKQPGRYVSARTRYFTTTNLGISIQLKRYTKVLV